MIKYDLPNIILADGPKNSGNSSSVECSILSAYVLQSLLIMIVKDTRSMIT